MSEGHGLQERKRHRNREWSEIEMFNTSFYRKSYFLLYLHQNSCGFLSCAILFCLLHTVFWAATQRRRRHEKSLYNDFEKIQKRGKRRENPTIKMNDANQRLAEGNAQLTAPRLIHGEVKSIKRRKLYILTWSFLFLSF